MTTSPTRPVDDGAQRLLGELDPGGARVRSTCSGRAAPTIAEATSARGAPRRARAAPSSARPPRPPASAAARPRAPRGCRGSGPSSGPCSRWRHANRRAAASRASTCRSGRPVRAATRRSGRSAPRAERDHVAPGSPPEDRVLRLARDEPLDVQEVERGLDLLGAPLAEAQVARLAGPDDVGERLHRLVERRVLVVAMALVGRRSPFSAA